MDTSFDFEHHDQMDNTKEQFSPNFTQYFNSPAPQFQQQQSPLLQQNNNHSSMMGRRNNNYLQAGNQTYNGCFPNTSFDMRMNRDFNQDSAYISQKNISQFDFDDEPNNYENINTLVQPFLKKNLNNEKQSEKQNNEIKIMKNFSFDQKSNQISPSNNCSSNNNQENSNANTNKNQGEKQRGRGRPKKNAESISTKNAIALKKTILKNKNQKTFSICEKNEEKQKTIKQDILKTSEEKQSNVCNYSLENSMQAEDESLESDSKSSSIVKEKKYQISTRQSNKTQRFNYQESSNETGDDKSDNEDKQEDFIDTSKSNLKEFKKKYQIPLNSNSQLLKQKARDENISQSQYILNKEPISLVGSKQNNSQDNIQQTKEKPSEKFSTTNFSLNNLTTDSLNKFSSQQILNKPIKSREQIQPQKKSRFFTEKINNTEIRSNDSTDISHQSLYEIKNNKYFNIDKKTYLLSKQQQNIQQEQNIMETPIKKQLQFINRQHQNYLFQSQKKQSKSFQEYIEQEELNQNQQKIRNKEENNNLSQQKTVKQIEQKNDKNSTLDSKINDSEIKNLKKEYLSRTQTGSSSTKKSLNSLKKIKKNYLQKNYINNNSPKNTKMLNTNRLKCLNNNDQQNILSSLEQLQLTNMHHNMLNKNINNFITMSDLTVDQSQFLIHKFSNDLENINNLKNVFSSVSNKVEGLLKQIICIISGNQTILTKQELKKQNEFDKQIDQLHQLFRNRPNDFIPNSNPIYDILPQQMMNGSFPKFSEK